MPRPVLLALFALLAVTLAAGTTPSTRTTMRVTAADTLGHFPAVEGSNLEGQHFALPADFRGELNLAFVAFKREQQEDVESWTPFLKSLADRQREIPVYEIPTLGRNYRFVRRFIDGGMRRGIPDAAVRAATITLYIDKEPFRDSLRITSEDHITVLLVDRQGRVLWRADGRYDASAGAELERRLARGPS